MGFFGGVEYEQEGEEDLVVVAAASLPLLSYTAAFVQSAGSLPFPRSNKIVRNLPVERVENEEKLLETPRLRSDAVNPFFYMLSIRKTRLKHNFMHGFSLLLSMQMP